VSGENVVTYLVININNISSSLCLLLQCRGYTPAAQVHKQTQF